MLYRTVQAEVPHFEVANSFYVMSLNGAGDELIDRHAEGIKFNAVADDVGADDASELATCCARLAKLVDEKPVLPRAGGGAGICGWRRRQRQLQLRQLRRRATLGIERKRWIPSWVVT